MNVTGFHRYDTPNFAPLSDGSIVAYWPTGTDVGSFTRGANSISKKTWTLAGGWGSTSVAFTKERTFALDSCGRIENGPDTMFAVWAETTASQAAGSTIEGNCRTYAYGTNDMVRRPTFAQPDQEPRCRDLRDADWYGPVLGYHLRNQEPSQALIRRPTSLLPTARCQRMAQRLRHPEPLSLLTTPLPCGTHRRISTAPISSRPSPMAVCPIVRRQHSDRRPWNRELCRHA